MKEQTFKCFSRTRNHKNRRIDGLGWIETDIYAVEGISGRWMLVNRRIRDLYAWGFSLSVAASCSCYTSSAVSIFFNISSEKCGLLRVREVLATCRRRAVKTALVISFSPLGPSFSKRRQRFYCSAVQLLQLRLRVFSAIYCWSAPAHHVYVCCGFCSSRLPSPDASFSTFYVSCWNFPSQLQSSASIRLLHYVFPTLGALSLLSKCYPCYFVAVRSTWSSSSTYLSRCQ